MRSHDSRPVIAHHEYERGFELAAPGESLADRADRRVHLLERAPHRLGVRRRLVGVAVHRRKLREDESPALIHRAQEVPRDGVVGWLVPEGEMRDRSPELALETRRVARRREPSRDRREDADALWDQLEDG